MNSTEVKDGSENPFIVTEKSVRDLQKNNFYSRFDTVLDADSTQQEVYDNGAKSLVTDVLNGYNTGMFAYGQSGGGKSFSLLVLPAT